MMYISDTVVLVKELHDDLARKYMLHGPLIENAWRSFDAEQREICLRAGAADGAVPEHVFDDAFDATLQLIPEWNLEEIASSGPDFLVDLLRCRATTTLYEQYCGVVDVREGDRDFILRLGFHRCKDAMLPATNGITLFSDDEDYCRSFDVMSNHDEVVMGLEAAVKAGLCVSLQAGSMILQRQLYLLQSLNLLIETILETGSTTRMEGSAPSPDYEILSKALSKLSVQTTKLKPSLSDLISVARERRDARRDYLELVRTEPIVLVHDVTGRFSSQPELVEDDKGCVMPVHTDKFISPAFFEATCTSTKAFAFWDYLVRLLEIYQCAEQDQTHRSLIRSELSNFVHWGYSLVQRGFKRYFQTATASRKFKRLTATSPACDAADTTVRVNLSSLTRTDPQMHYLLRLCLPETDVFRSHLWLEKLDQLYNMSPIERARLTEREFDSLCDLATTVDFVRDLSRGVTLPAPSARYGQLFVSRSKKLDLDLMTLKNKLDLRDLAIPIDNLLEPGISDVAVKTFDAAAVRELGADITSLYETLVEDSLSSLQNQSRAAKSTNLQPTSMHWPSQAHLKLQSQKLIPMPEKVKLRSQLPKPPDETGDEMVGRIEDPPEPWPVRATADNIMSPEKFVVSPSTAAVFATLFDGSRQRGSIKWDSFNAAMAELGFAISPNFGSVYTFSPPVTLSLASSLIFHRPHQSKIEGYKLLLLARRLKRLYGWKKSTFAAV